MIIRVGYTVHNMSSDYELPEDFYDRFTALDTDGDSAWLFDDEKNAQSCIDAIRDAGFEPKVEYSHGFAIAVWRTPHGKLYAQTFNPNQMDAKHVHSDPVVWESAHGEVLPGGEDDMFASLLDDCPEEYLDVASHAID